MHIYYSVPLVHVISFNLRKQRVTSFSFTFTNQRTHTQKAQ